MSSLLAQAREIAYCLVDAPTLEGAQRRLRGAISEVLVGRGLGERAAEILERTIVIPCNFGAPGFGLSDTGSAMLRDAGPLRVVHCANAADAELSREPSDEEAGANHRLSEVLRGCDVADLRDLSRTPDRISNPSSRSSADRRPDGYNGGLSGLAKYVRGVSPRLDSPVDTRPFRGRREDA